MTNAEAVYLLTNEKKYMESHGGDAQAEALEMAIKALEEQRTGYWIMHFYEISPSDSTMECSECGEELTAMYVKGDYCPNCGSKNKVKHGDKKK